MVSLPFAEVPSLSATDGAKYWSIWYELALREARYHAGCLSDDEADPLHPR